MDLATLDAPSRGAARAAFLEYRHAVLASLDAEADLSIDVARREALERRRLADEAIMVGYRHLSMGRQVIDVRQTVASGGVDAAGRPHIALARADLERVRLSMWGDGEVHFDHPARAGRSRSAARIELPPDTLPRDNRGWRQATAIVPSIPPRLRPTARLERFWVMFEAEYQAPPVDPALLKPIGAGLAVVVAVWDLTPLERAVLGMTRTPS